MQGWATDGQLRDEERHVVSSGGSYWYKEGRGSDCNQVEHNPLEHGRLDLYPPFLESIPMEICQHRCHAASHLTSLAALHCTISSLLILRFDIALTVCGSYTQEEYSNMGITRDL